MKRRIKKLIDARMREHPSESYEVAKLIVLQKERNAKLRFRNTLEFSNRRATLHGAKKVLSAVDAVEIRDRIRDVGR